MRAGFLFLFHFIFLKEFQSFVVVSYYFSMSFQVCYLEKRNACVKINVDIYYTVCLLLQFLLDPGSNIYKCILLHTNVGAAVNHYNNINYLKLKIKPYVKHLKGIYIRMYSL